MKNNLKWLALGIGLMVTISACHHNRPKPQPKVEDDSFHAGKTTFGVDASIAPIVDEEAFVFKGLYPDARPVLEYQPEAQIINKLLNDSIRFALLSRDLTAEEKKLLNDRGFTPNINPFAHDAVVLIVNQVSADTLMSVTQIKQMLNGKTNADKDIVFANPNSSTIRYFKEISGSDFLKLKNVYALKTDKDVITYVSQHPQAIGAIGFSWLDDPDEDYAAAAAKVKVVGIKDAGNKKYPDEYYKPSQSTLALKQYPFARSLYVVNSTGKMGLGAGFENFILSDRGQRIILKSGLLPDSIPQRQINVRKQVTNSN